MQHKYKWTKHPSKEFDSMIIQGWTVVNIDDEEEKALLERSVVNNPKTKFSKRGT